MMTLDEWAFAAAVLLDEVEFADLAA